MVIFVLNPSTRGCLSLGTLSTVLIIYGLPPKFLALCWMVILGKILIIDHLGWCNRKLCIVNMCILCLQDAGYSPFVCVLLFCKSSVESFLLVLGVHLVMPHLVEAV